MSVTYLSEDVRAGHTLFYRKYETVLEWMPYVVLLVSTALSFVDQQRDWSYRWVTVAMAVGAALWVFVTHTRVPVARRDQPLLFGVYFAGMLGFAAFLMTRDVLFFIFALTGFFHAVKLRPWPLILAGVCGTSIIVNTSFTGLPDDVQGWSIYLAIVVVQTLAIGGGHVVGLRIETILDQRHKAADELEAAMQENAGLHMQLLTQAREAGVLDERQRMAREIHDTVAQGLTGVIAQVQAAGNKGIDSVRRQQHLDNAAALARDSLAEARRSVMAVGPPAFDQARLPEALTELARKWSHVNRVPVEVTTTGDARTMHPEIDVTLLRTAQEALSNAGKYADASRVGLTLTYMEDMVTLDIRDDGIGFDPDKRVTAKPERGYGLTAMRQRVTRLAGTLSIESEPGNGTAISACLPAIAQAVGDE